MDAVGGGRRGGGKGGGGDGGSGGWVRHAKGGVPPLRGCAKGHPPPFSVVVFVVVHSPHQQQSFVRPSNVMGWVVNEGGGGRSGGDGMRRRGGRRAERE